MKKHTIIGTAGHIDHGKTAVVKSLTGIDADRLKEEKERGITIDIGFAYWKEEVTIIDVPGHEKFIRNMVAGVSTIDFFLLVIAADDGVMPQTVEHLDILNVFNIRDGIVVINKTDLVDEEWLEIIRDDVRSLMDGYGLSDLEVVEVSAISNINIDILKTKIEEKIISLKSSPSSRPFRLFADRSFSIKGFGTVVTGTVLSGSLQKGDDVEIQPAARKLRVRGLQAHTVECESVSEGDRAAINLHGIEKEEITRGDVLCAAGTMMPVSEFLGVMKTVSKIPAKIANRSHVHVYTGTGEGFGQVIWFEGHNQLLEKTEYHVRVKLEAPVSAARGDAFLIRLHSPVLTLAGGVVAEINPQKIRHIRGEWNDHFRSVTENDLVSVVEYTLKQSGLNARSVRWLQQKFFEKEDTVKKILLGLVDRKRIREIKIKGTETYIHNSGFEQLLEKIRVFFDKYHAENPLSPGLNFSEIVNGMQIKWLPPEITETALAYLLNSKSLRTEQNLYARSDFKIQTSRDSDEAGTEILMLIQKARFAPPAPADLQSDLNLAAEEIQSLFSSLVRQKKLVLIARNFYLHYKTWEELLQFLRSYFEKNSEMPVAALKEFIQTTRKFAIPLFEYLDAESYTRRAGDIRKRGERL